jgi:DNA-binding LytR/AlgR family response regulator
MNILICEDVRYEAGILGGLLADSGFDVNTTVFYNAQDALAYTHTGAPLDICFLDILMPGMTGVELAETLREDGYSGFIVFITSNRSYAPESYKVKAFNYLIKPITPEKIKEVLTEIDSILKAADSGSILIKSASISRMVLFREISHIEVTHNSIHFRMTNGVVHVTRATLAEIAPKLMEDSRFVQCHRSFVVNINDISELKGNTFTMRSGHAIPISRSHPDAKDKYLLNLSGAQRTTSYKHTEDA